MSPSERRSEQQGARRGDQHRAQCRGVSPRDGGAGQNADDRDEQDRVLGAEQVEERVDNEAARGGPGQIDEIVPADRSRVGSSTIATPSPEKKYGMVNDANRSAVDEIRVIP